MTAVGRVCEIPQDSEEDENVRYVIDVRKVNNEKVRDKTFLLPIISRNTVIP